MKNSIDRLIDFKGCNKCAYENCICPPISIYVSPTGIGPDGKKCHTSIDKAIQAATSKDTVILRSGIKLKF